MENYLFISEAAKEVQVESHVLRYWEEELHLPIRRNEQGHRYYTKEDVELFKQIKRMKEKGLQLKAIKMVLKDGKLNIVEEDTNQEIILQEGEEKAQEADAGIAVPVRLTTDEIRTTEETREEKARRLQWLLQQLIRETLKENNKELCEEIKESVLKELDYQFRIQEEHQEERDRKREEKEQEREKKEQEREKREEQYYQKLDKLLRSKSNSLRKKEEDTPEEVGTIVRDGKMVTKEKKKRHFIF